MYLFKAIARLLTVKNNKILWQSLGIVCRLRLGIIIGQASLSDYLHCRRGIINWQASTFVRHHCTGIIRQAPLYRHCCLTIFIVREASSTQASIGQASSTDRHHWTGIVVWLSSLSERHHQLTSINICQASLNRLHWTGIVWLSSLSERHHQLTGNNICQASLHCTGIIVQASMDRLHWTGIIIRQASSSDKHHCIIRQESLSDRHYSDSALSLDRHHHRT